MSLLCVPSCRGAARRKRGSSAEHALERQASWLWNKDHPTSLVSIPESEQARVSGTHVLRVFMQDNSFRTVYISEATTAAETVNLVLGKTASTDFASFYTLTIQQPGGFARGALSLNNEAAVLPAVLACSSAQVVLRAAQSPAEPTRDTVANLPKDINMIDQTKHMIEMRYCVGQVTSDTSTPCLNNVQNAFELPNNALERSIASPDMLTTDDRGLSATSLEARLFDGMQFGEFNDGLSTVPSSSAFSVMSSPGGGTEDDGYIDVEVGTWVSDGKFEQTPLTPIGSKAFRKNKRIAPKPRKGEKNPDPILSRLREPAITIGLEPTPLDQATQESTLHSALGVISGNATRIGDAEVFLSPKGRGSSAKWKHDLNISESKTTGVIWCDNIKSFKAGVQTTVAATVLPPQALSSTQETQVVAKDTSPECTTEEPSAPSISPEIGNSAPPPSNIPVAQPPASLSKPSADRPASPTEEPWFAVKETSIRKQFSVMNKQQAEERKKAPIRAPVDHVLNELHAALMQGRKGVEGGGPKPAAEGLPSTSNSCRPASVTLRQSCNQPSVGFQVNSVLQQAKEMRKQASTKGSVPGNFSQIQADIVGRRRANLAIRNSNGEKEYISEAPPSEVSKSTTAALHAPPDFEIMLRQKAAKRAAKYGGETKPNAETARAMPSLPSPKPISAVLSAKEKLVKFMSVNTVEGQQRLEDERVKLELRKKPPPYPSPAPSQAFSARANLAKLLNEEKDSVPLPPQNVAPESLVQATTAVFEPAAPTPAPTKSTRKTAGKIAAMQKLISPPRAHVCTKEVQTVNHAARNKVLAFLEKRIVRNPLPKVGPIQPVQKERVSQEHCAVEESPDEDHDIETKYKQPRVRVIEADCDDDFSHSNIRNVLTNLFATKDTSHVNNNDEDKTTAANADLQKTMRAARNKLETLFSPTKDKVQSSAGSAEATATTAATDAPNADLQKTMRAARNKLETLFSPTKNAKQKKSDGEPRSHEKSVRFALESQGVDDSVAVKSLSTSGNAPPPPPPPLPKHLTVCRGPPTSSKSGSMPPPPPPLPKHLTMGRGTVDASQPVKKNSGNTHPLNPPSSVAVL